MAGTERLVGRSVVRPRCQGAISESLLCASLRCVMIRWKLLWAGEETNESRGKWNCAICKPTNMWQSKTQCNQCPENNYTSRIHTDTLLSGTITCKSTIIFVFHEWGEEVRGGGTRRGFPGLATMTIKHILRWQTQTQSASCLRLIDGFIWDCTLRLSEYSDMDNWQRIYTIKKRETLLKVFHELRNVGFV